MTPAQSMQCRGRSLPYRRRSQWASHRRCAGVLSRSSYFPLKDAVRSLSIVAPTHHGEQVRDDQKGGRRGDCTPPMTARASTAFCSSPGSPIAIGIIPTIIAAAVMSTGRIRVSPASRAASCAHLPASRCSRAKVTSRIEFADATPTAMMAPISEGTFRVVSVTNSIVRMPAFRQREDHNERIDEALIIYHHKHINEYRGEDETKPEVPERRRHALDLAPDESNVIARRQLRLELPATTFCRSAATPPRSRSCTLP